MGAIIGLFVFGILSIPIFIYLFLYATIIIIVAIIIIYFITAYIFESISIMNICKNISYKNCFLAWIPIYNKYLLCKIIETKALFLIRTICNIILLTIIYYWYIKSINFITFSILLIVIIIKFILESIISYKLFKNVTNRYGDILTILNIITLGLITPIFLFIVRNKIQVSNHT